MEVYAPNPIVRCIHITTTLQSAGQLLWCETHQLTVDLAPSSTQIKPECCKVVQIDVDRKVVRSHKHGRVVEHASKRRSFVQECCASRCSTCP